MRKWWYVLWWCQQLHLSLCRRIRGRSLSNRYGLMTCQTRYRYVIYTFLWAEWLFGRKKKPEKKPICSQKADGICFLVLKLGCVLLFHLFTVPRCSHHRRCPKSHDWSILIHIWPINDRFHLSNVILSPSSTMSTHLTLNNSFVHALTICSWYMTKVLRCGLLFDLWQIVSAVSKKFSTSFSSTTFHKPEY